MQLQDMKCGDKGKIVAIRGASPLYKQRLIAMGLLPGTEFSVVRIAPLGDPVQIAVRGVALSLRKLEANVLVIDEVKV